MISEYITPKNIVLILILVLISVFANEKIIYLSLIPLGFYFLKTAEKSVIISAILILLLTLISDISEYLRFGVNISAIFILLFFFFTEYGSKIKIYPKLPPAIIYFILFLIATTILSVLFSSNINKGLIFLIKEIIFLLLIYLFYSFIKNDKNIKQYIYALIIPSLIISVSIGYDFLTSPSALFMFQTLGFTINTAYINNAAAAGGLFTVTIPLTYYLIIINRNPKNLKYFSLIVILLLQLAALILTNSRAAFLGSFVATAFIILSYHRKYKLKILTVFFSSLVLLVVLNPFIVDAFLLLIRADRIFDNPRYNLWEISFNIIKENPIFGTGPGNFATYIYKYNPVLLNSYSAIDIKYIYEFVSIGHSHNFYLFMFSEMGILGFINSIIIPFLFFKYSFTVKKVISNHDYNDYWLTLTIIGCGFGLFARSIFESTGIMSYGWITRDLPFWILFSIIIYLNNKYNL